MAGRDHIPPGRRQAIAEGILPPPPGEASPPPAAPRPRPRAPAPAVEEPPSAAEVPEAPTELTYPSLPPDPEVEGIDLAGPWRFYADLVRQEDVAAAIERCRAALQKVVNPEDGRQVRAALEDAARVAYLGRRLHLLAKHEAAAVGQQVGGTRARWRMEALRFFTEAKSRGVMAKQVTEKLLDDYARQTRPGSYERAAALVEDSTLVCEDLEALHKALMERSRNLRAMEGGYNDAEDSRREADFEAGRGFDR